MFSIRPLSLKSLVLAAVLCVSSTALAQRYSQTNLVSDIPGLAALTDSNLVNPWGIAFGPKTPFWIADNGTGVSTIYKPDGTKLPLTVTIPPTGTSGTSAPTGAVFNGTADFVVSGNGASGPAIFLFATEDGTISGWNPNVDLTQAVLVVDNSALSAVYKGLALAETPEGSFLYATNFHDGIVEMYDTKFELVKTFTDTSVPPGYAPFGIRNIRGKLFVTFALQNDEKHDDVAGPGHGFVDVFDLGGHKLQRLVSGGPLNSPWGLALAPANFGKFSNALLVGNFGDGRISGFNPKSGASLGSLKNSRGVAIQIDGLWALAFGNGNAAGQTNELFFTAGIGGEAHGLFGKIQSES